MCQYLININAYNTITFINADNTFTVITYIQYTIITVTVIAVNKKVTESFAQIIALSS